VLLLAMTTCVTALTHPPGAAGRWPPQKDLWRVSRRVADVQQKLGRSFKIKQVKAKDKDKDSDYGGYEEKGVPIKGGPFFPKSQKSQSLPGEAAKEGLVAAQQLDYALGSKDPWAVDDVLQAASQRAASSGDPSGPLLGGGGMAAATAPANFSSLLDQPAPPAADVNDVALVSRPPPDTGTSLPLAPTGSAASGTSASAASAASAAAAGELGLPQEDLVGPRAALSESLLRSFGTAVDDFVAGSGLVTRLLQLPTTAQLQGDLSERLGQATQLVQQQVQEKEGRVAARRKEVSTIDRVCIPAGWACMHAVAHIVIRTIIAAGARLPADAILIVIQPRTFCCRRCSAAG
jgi:hypothetical protein